jgi:hypothetical protein
MEPDTFAGLDLARFSGLDISRYRLVLRAVEPASLPAFLGSTLRGAFGHALKDAVCVMPHRNCDRCMVMDRCLYPYLFETAPPEHASQLKGQQQAPHPFILTPDVAQAGSLRSSRVPSTAPMGTSGPRLLKQPLRPRVSVSPPPGVVPSERRILLRPGDAISFDLVLLGRAIDYMPYIVFAVSEMARRGLGANRTRFELDEVTMLGLAGERPIYSGRTQRISTAPDARLPLADLIRDRLDARSSATHHSSLSTHHCSLRFLAPTRIRIEGDAQFSLSFDLLIRSLLRRLSLLAEVHGRGPLNVDYRGLIERATQVRVKQSRLRWSDFERYSNRQRCKMKLGGFVGEIEYEGEAIDEFLPLIAAGEILHVGSNTTFGLGLYEIAGQGGV